MPSTPRSLALAAAAVITLAGPAVAATCLHVAESSAGTTALVPSDNFAVTRPGTAAPLSCTSAALRGKVGVNALALWNPSAESDLKVMAASGVTWVRADFAWAALEPYPGRFNWQPSDRLMTAAARTGVNILAIADYSSAWASSDPSAGRGLYFPPKNFRQFAEYAAQVARRYGRTGTFWVQHPELSPRPLTALEIWNEPWGYWNWRPEPDAASYARLVRTTAAAVRPDIDLLASGDLQMYKGTRTLPWLESLLSADPSIAKTIDGWSIHPYGDPPSLAPWDTSHDPDYTFLGRVEKIRSILRARAATRPLWITEIGWCTAGGKCGDVDEARQATYLTWALETASTRWSGDVARVFVFTWEKKNDVPGDWKANFGLRRKNGTYTPAWRALVQLLA